MHKVVRKVRASNELYHWVIGSIDTPEKFQAKRHELAEHVWKSMQETDSRECRNCHEYDHMTLQKQTIMAKRTHELGVSLGNTCIDCHQGVSHTLPAEFDRGLQSDALHKKIEQQEIACYECHEDLYNPVDDEEW
jgi:cytochrome c-type protein NapC